MGQQIRKVTKRRRRIEYLKRKKEQSKLNSNAPIRLAVAVAKDAKPAAKEAPAKKTAAKAPAKKTETKAAAAYIDRYFQRYPGVKNYMDSTRQIAKDQGYVETVLGRRLYLPEINSPNGPRRAGAERAAINAPMQGTAADLIKLSMNAVQQVLDAEQRQTKMIMQVHDELVFEVPEAEVEWVRTEIPRLMAGVAALKVPLLAEIGFGPNWEQAH